MTEPKSVIPQVIGIFLTLSILGCVGFWAFKQGYLWKITVDGFDSGAVPHECPVHLVRLEIETIEVKTGIVQITPSELSWRMEQISRTEFPHARREAAIGLWPARWVDKVRIKFCPVCRREWDKQRALLREKPESAREQ